MTLAPGGSWTHPPARSGYLWPPTPTCPEGPQQAAVGDAVASQLVQEGVETQPVCGFRRERAGGTPGPQRQPWGHGRLRPRPTLCRGDWGPQGGERQDGFGCSAGGE